MAVARLGAADPQAQEEPLTYADLQRLPETHHERYELLDGFLFVTPAPNTRHQDCVANLLVALKAAAPADLKVMVSPFDWVVDQGNVFESDLLVARRGDVGPQRVERPPVLVVEVLSPTTRLRDLTLKRGAYQRAGVPSYWIADPDVPSLTVLRLEDERYVTAAVVVADEAFEATDPFPVTVVPIRLLG